MDNHTVVKQFLQSQGLFFGDVDLDIESDAFSRELSMALLGSDECSLPSIPTFISPDGELKSEQRAIVIDAGGTNFRVATVFFDKQKQAVIENFAKYPMPGTDKEITYEEFNSRVADYLCEIIDKGDRIGVCFSYECDIQKNRDGRLVSLSKEVYISGAAGNLVCEGINNELIRRGYNNKHFCLLNDTVATMLGGLSISGHRKFDSFAGFIFGTGTNLCYVEDAKKIVKSPDAIASGGHMVINVESGKYSKIKRSDIEKEFDATTLNPGEHQFEKMVSGAYQGTLLLRILTKACEYDIFSDLCADKIKRLENLSGRDIDNFYKDPNDVGTLASLCDNKDDIDRLLLMCDMFYRRIAKLVTIQLAGLIKHTGYGTCKSQPLCVVAEGTTFYKSQLFKPCLDYYVKSYIEDKLHRYVEFVYAENATLVGTATAALLN